MKISLFLEGVKKADRKPEGVNGDTKTINMDDPLPDVGNELYDGNWEDLEESILDEDNVPERDVEEEAYNQQQEEPPN